jgi:hypothetical protein
VVNSGKEASGTVHPVVQQAGGAPRAAWEVVGGPMPEPIDRKGKGKGKGKRIEEEIDAKESSLQMALSYAGLVAALIVVLLGVIIMVGTGR